MICNAMLISRWRRCQFSNEIDENEKKKFIKRIWFHTVCQMCCYSIDDWLLLLTISSIVRHWKIIFIFSLNHSLLSHFTTCVLYFPANTNRYRYMRRLTRICTMYVPRTIYCVYKLQMINDNERKNVESRRCHRCRHYPRQICVHDFINLMRNELNPCTSRVLRTTPHSSVSNMLRKLVLFVLPSFYLYISFHLCHRAISFGAFIACHSYNTISRSLFHPLLNRSSSASSSSSSLVSKHIHQKHHFLSLHVSHCIV